MLLVTAASPHGGVLGSGLASVFPEHGASDRGSRVAHCGKRSPGREVEKWAGKQKVIPELNPESER